jgi:hypothetical protein
VPGVVEDIAGIQVMPEVAEIAFEKIRKKRDGRLLWDA